MSTGTHKKRKRSRTPPGGRATRPRESGSAHEARLRSKGTATPKRPTPPGPRGLSGGTKLALVIGGSVLVLGALFLINNRGGSGSKDFKFQVGTPGPGQQAPPIRLASTEGGTFDLSSMRGKTVLLYFQEGLTCQPCWDQIKDIDANMGQFKALGVDQVVTITTDQVDAVKQKASDEGLTTPVLSDPNLSVSRAYRANQYGMMGTSRDGHSFLVVGPTGRIEWRADYGGPPDYTMFLPLPSLLRDLRQGLRANST